MVEPVPKASSDIAVVESDQDTQNIALSEIIASL